MDVSRGASAGSCALARERPATKIFPHASPSPGGVLSIAVRPGDIFGDSRPSLTGCGDGCLKVLQGFDPQWTRINETHSGRILAYLSADGRELRHLKHLPAWPASLRNLRFGSLRPPLACVALQADLGVGVRARVVGVVHHRVDLRPPSPLGALAVRRRVPDRSSGKDDRRVQRDARGVARVVELA